MMKEKYETLPLTTLKELAKARGLKGISTMKKAQVIELMLQEDEKEQEKEKLAGLGGQPMHVDTGDADADEYLKGYYKIIFKNSDSAIYKVG